MWFLAHSVINAVRIALAYSVEPISEAGRTRGMLRINGSLMLSRACFGLSSPHDV